MLLSTFAFILALKKRDDFIPFMCAGLMEGLFELMLLAHVITGL